VRHFLKAFKQMNATAPNFGYGREPTSMWWRSLVKQTFANSTISIPATIDMDHVGDELYESFKSGDAWEQFEEVDHVLREIRALGVKIVVLSNFDERLVCIFP
jgi:FMN phosphatase YigB (HAD superfamily)